MRWAMDSASCSWQVGAAESVGSTHSMLTQLVHWGVRRRRLLCTVRTHDDEGA
jgi:hypothetical protein